MNIIYFNTHDSGRYISPYGYKVPTQNIEKFARESILFRQAYSASPTCSPSRGALLSGMYAHNNGLIGLSHRGFKMNDYNKHIGSYLRENGYRTAIAGTEHIANHGLLEQHNMNYDVLPYDDILGPASDDNDIQNAKAVADYILEYNKDENFFISFGLWNTHRKYPEEITEGYEPDYIKVPSKLKDTYMNREDFAHYCTSVKIADDCFKMVLDALKEKGIYDDTIIIFTTDHGLPSPFMKCTLFDSGMRVSLVLRVPDSPMNGRVVESMFSQIDLFPTICELIDLEIPEYIQGISQKPVIMNEKDKVRDQVYAEINYHASYQPMRCIRTEEYKYIRIFDNYKKPMLANIDSSNPKELLLSNQFDEYEIKDEYLFNTVIDPQEKENLVDDHKYNNVLNEMRHKLNDFMKETNDFLLNDKIEVPKGVVVNAPSANTPKDKRIFY